MKKRTVKKSAKQIVVQEALQVTWRLKGELKNARIACLRIGALLVEVRDRKLYAELHHPDLEDYAEKRLNLARTTLYRFINSSLVPRHFQWNRRNRERLTTRLRLETRRHGEERKTPFSAFSKPTNVARISHRAHLARNG